MFELAGMEGVNILGNMVLKITVKTELFSFLLQVDTAGKSIITDYNTFNVFFVTLPCHVLGLFLALFLLSSMLLMNE